jgi:hypothetical protein
MKKLLVVLSFVLIALFSFNTSVYAFEPVANENISDTTIVKFDYYPDGSLSSERTLVFKWLSEEEMKDLLILLYIPSENKHKVIFDLSWDLENMDTELEVDFEMVAPPADDPETPDIDESTEKYWQYKLTFELQKDKYGLLRFCFMYHNEVKVFKNDIYLPNVVYPQNINPTPPPANNGEKDDQTRFFNTSNALIAAILAAGCSIVGTVLIIISSQRRKFGDEEIE